MKEKCIENCEHMINNPYCFCKKYGYRVPDEKENYFCLDKTKCVKLKMCEEVT